MANNDAADWKTKLLPVASLDLDQKNPRLGGLAHNSTPREIVQQLFLHDKAADIAESIATRGYFPNEPLLAVRENGRFVVVEGNRRLAALMALREPGLLEAPHSKKIDKLSKRIAKDDLKKVPVTIAPNRRATDKQVAGRHVGTPVLAWQAENRARFILEKLEEGYESQELFEELGFSPADVQAARETRAIVEMARSLDLPEEVKAKIDDPRTKAVSTLARLFESKTGREIMNIERDPEHGYRGTTTKAAFLPFFKKLVTEIATNNVSTRTLNTNEDIKKYFSEKWDPADLPAKKRGSFVPSDLARPNQLVPESPASPKPSPRQQPIFNTVLPRNLKVKYGAPRLALIRDELVALDRETKPNAGAVLLRVFFELTVVDYLKRSGRMAQLEAKLTAKNVKWKHDYPDMKHLLDEVKDVARKNLRSSEAHAVEKVLYNNRSTPFGLTDLHAFVHVPAELPRGTDIFQFWLRIEPLLRLMLETDPSTHK